METYISNGTNSLNEIIFKSDEEQDKLIQKWYLRALCDYSEKVLNEEFGMLEWERMMSVMNTLFTQSIVISDALEPSEQSSIEEALADQHSGLELRWSRTVDRVCDAVIEEWEEYMAWQTIALPVLRITSDSVKDERAKKCHKNLFEDGQFLLKSRNHLFILPVIICSNIDNSIKIERWFSFCIIVTKDLVKIGNMASKLLQVHSKFWSTASLKILEIFIENNRIFHCIYLSIYLANAAGLVRYDDNNIDLIQIFNRIQTFVSNSEWRTMQIKNFAQLSNMREIWLHPFHGDYNKYFSQNCAIFCINERLIITLNSILYQNFQQDSLINYKLREIIISIRNLGLECIKYFEEKLKQINETDANEPSMQILKFVSINDPITEPSFQHSLLCMFLNFVKFLINTNKFFQFKSYEEVHSEIRQIKAAINFLLIEHELKQFIYKIPWQFKSVEIATNKDIQLSSNDRVQSGDPAVRHLSTTRLNKKEKSISYQKNPELRSPNFRHRCAISQANNLVKKVLRKFPHSTGEIIKTRLSIFYLVDHIPNELEAIRIAEIRRFSSHSNSIRY